MQELRGKAMSRLLVWHAAQKRIIWLKYALAAATLGALYYAADWRAVCKALRAVELDALFAALALFVPQTIVSAWRWRWLGGAGKPLAFGESLSCTLAASGLNLFLPAKVGDLCRGALHCRDFRGIGSGVFGTLLEKIADVAVLLLLIGLGLIGAATSAVTLLCALGLIHWMSTEWAKDWPRWQHWVRLAWHTGLLWALHMVQIACFFHAAGIDVSSNAFLARMPIALFAGLIPLTPCGLGTRDAALMVLFADLASPASLAVVGLLTASRYLVPGLVGLPFFWTWTLRSPSTVVHRHTGRLDGGAKTPAVDACPVRAQRASTSVDPVALPIR